VKELVIWSQCNVYTLVSYGAGYYAYCLSAGCIVQKMGRFRNKMDRVAIIEFG